MKIELRQAVPKQAPSYTGLYVNGAKLGEYICGKDKPYLDPEAWAKRQLAKRLPVIAKNIMRLEAELAAWKKEESLLKEV